MREEEGGKKKQMGKESDRASSTSMSGTISADNGKTRTKKFEPLRGADIIGSHKRSKRDQEALT